MSKWRQISVGEFVTFNPPERIGKGELAKKIPMAMLTEFERKIKGYVFAKYQSGPKFKNGDTLVAKITPCLENGKTAQVDILDEGEVAFGSSEFIVLRENALSINDYIFYLAKSPVFRERAIGCMEGTSGRKRVNEGALKRQEIKVPDKLTQQKIASVLSALDNKIELNNRINAELEAMAKTIYDYWFVQFDFPDANGKPYKSSGGKMLYNEVLKREVPEGWEVKSLDNLYNFQYGLGNNNPDNGGEYPIYGSNGIIGGYDKFNNEDAPVIGHIGANCGSLIFAKGKHYVTYNGVMCKIKDGYNKFFGYAVLKSKDLKQVRRGSTQPFISYDLLHSLSFAKPTKIIQKSFDAFITPLFKEIINNDYQNQHLSQLRDWLLPMLMNGQVSAGKAYEQVQEVLSVAAEDTVEYGRKKK